MSDEIEQEQQARDRLVRFIAGLLGQLPRKAVEQCREDALTAWRYANGEALNDSYCQDLAGSLLGGWAIRNMIAAGVREQHGALCDELDKVKRRNNRLEAVIEQLAYPVGQLQSAAEAFDKARAPEPDAVAPGENPTR
jgi:hypothetical protein